MLHGARDAGRAEPALSPRTDVYLLGAVLYEIFTGRPPHDGNSLSEVFAKVLASRPPLPQDCPVELSRICRMAMDPEPAWRYESVEELRLALSRFLQHAGSHRLQAEAHERSEPLQRLLAQDAVDQARERVATIQNLFGEIRFAYRQALDILAGKRTGARGLAARDAGGDRPRAAPQQRQWCCELARESRCAGCQAARARRARAA